MKGIVIVMASLALALMVTPQVVGTGKMEQCLHNPLKCTVRSIENLITVIDVTTEGVESLLELGHAFVMLGRAINGDVTAARQVGEGLYITPIAAYLVKRFGDILVVQDVSTSSRALYSGPVYDCSWPFAPAVSGGIIRRRAECSN